MPLVVFKPIRERVAMVFNPLLFWLSGFMFNGGVCSLAGNCVITKPIKNYLRFFVVRIAKTISNLFYGTLMA
jgi:hypothetical protein